MMQNLVVSADDDGRLPWEAGMRVSGTAHLMPRDIAAEAAVLGGVMLAPETVYVAMEHVQTEDFYLDANRCVFKAMCDLAGKSEPIDVITVGSLLHLRGELEGVGGATYLSELDSPLADVATVAAHARIVADHALSRRVIEMAHGIAMEGYQSRTTGRDLAVSAEGKILALADQRIKNSPQLIGRHVAGRIASYGERYERRSNVTGVPTGLADLDDLTAGWQKKHLIIIGGRPSSGKSSLTMNLIAHAGIKENLTCLVFSMEDTKESYIDRMIARESRVSGDRIRTGQFQPADFPRMGMAEANISRSKIIIDDSRNLSAMDIAGRAKQVKKRFPELAIITIDYLQVARLGKEQREDQQLGAFTKRIKDLASELDVPIILLSQLSRAGEKENRKPRMSDLKGSGNIEADADEILLTHCDAQREGTDEKKGVLELIVVKQKDGKAPATLELAYLADIQRIELLDRHANMKAPHYENGRLVDP